MNTAYKKKFEEVLSPYKSMYELALKYKTEYTDKGTIYGINSINDSEPIKVVNGKPYNPLIKMYFRNEKSALIYLKVNHIVLKELVLAMHENFTDEKTENDKIQALYDKEEEVIKQLNERLENTNEENLLRSRCKRFWKNLFGKRTK